MKVPGVDLRHVARVLLAGSLLAVYLATLAPGLTWANGGSDGGDLIAAAATGGVPHPTGYPVYMLVAGLFQLLPVGSLAFRTNLLSMVSTVAAAVLVSETVWRSLRDGTRVNRILAGCAAGAAFGLAPLVWSQAVITEVYALHGLFVALLVYLVVTGEGGRKASLGIGLALGLAVGNHVLAVLMAPVVLGAVAVRRIDPSTDGCRVASRLRLQPGAAVIACLGFMVGIASYAVLPLRAAAHPPINWGVPVTLDRLGWLVFGGPYQDSLLQLDPGSLWTQMQTWAGLVLRQNGIVGLGLSLAGLVLGFSVSRVYLVTVWAAFASTAFSLQYGVVDSHVHLIPLFLALAIWLGLGVGELGRLIPARTPATTRLLGAAVLAYVMLFGLSNWQLVNASQDTRAEDFGRQLLAAAPPGAMIFAEGDRAVFTAWYFHYALRLRPDLVVIASTLLPFDWYRETLRDTYPMLAVPSTAPDLWMPAILRLNSGRAACFASADLPGLRCQQGEGR